MTTEALTQLRYKTLIDRLKNQDPSPTLVDLLAVCHAALTKVVGKPVFVSRRTIQEDLRKLREGAWGKAYPIEVVQKKYYRIASSADVSTESVHEEEAETMPDSATETMQRPFYFGDVAPEKALSCFPIKRVTQEGKTWLLYLCPETGELGALPEDLFAQAKPLPDFPGWKQRRLENATDGESATDWLVASVDWPFWTWFGVNSQNAVFWKTHQWRIPATPPWWFVPKELVAEPDKETHQKWEKKLVDRLDRKGFTPPLSVLSCLLKRLLHGAAPYEIPNQDEVSLSPELMFWIQKWLGISSWLKSIEKVWGVSFHIKGYWEASQHGILQSAEGEIRKGTKHQLVLYLNPAEDSSLNFAVWPGSQKQKEPDLFKPSKSLILPPGSLWVCKAKTYRQLQWNPATPVIRLDFIPISEENED